MHFFSARNITASEGDTVERLQVIAGQSIKGGLTAKQDAFAQGVANGKTLSEAYRASYSAEGMKDSSVWTEASKLMDNPKVSQKIGAGAAPC